MNKEVEKIENLRYKKEWSVYKLAKMSGVAESTIDFFGNLVRSMNSSQFFRPSRKN